MRNNWLNKGKFKIEDCDVSFDLVRCLHKEDQKRTVKLAPQLTVKVVSPTSTERQCVRYAATLFSPSVSSALEVYSESDPQQFTNALPVVQFLKRINEFWCWSNIQNLQQGHHSRDPNQQPFQSDTDWRLDEMESMKTWLINWNSNAKTALTRETYSAFLITLTGIFIPVIKRLLTEEHASFV